MLGEKKLTVISLSWSRSSVMGSKITSNFKMLESGSSEIMTVDLPEYDFSEQKTRKIPTIASKIPNKNREIP